MKNRKTKSEWSWLLLFPSPPDPGWEVERVRGGGLKNSSLLPLKEGLAGKHLERQKLERKRRENPKSPC